jgi:monofunctional biosynthetic peptidoglycan transglycosylase
MRVALRWLAAIGAAGFAVMAYVYLTLPDVRPLATTNPGTTAFMELRAREAARDGRQPRQVQRWIPYTRVSPHLKRAVLVAEDSGFWEHEGVDIQQIRASFEVNLERGRAVRGASTITQQLAKNLYLSPSRNPVRKFKELIIARRLEAALPKARILELYLNVIEWGDGIWGAEAAAQRYFGTSASAVGPGEAALLAGAIINPRVLNPARPNPRLLRRQRIILGRMGDVTPPAPTLVAAEAAQPPAVPDAPAPATSAAPATVDQPPPPEPQPPAEEPRTEDPPAAVQRPCPFPPCPPVPR